MLFNILKIRKNYHLTKVVNTLTLNNYLIIITPDIPLLQNLTIKFTFLQIKANLMRVFLETFLKSTKQIFDLRALIRTNVYYFPFKDFNISTFLQFPMQIHLGLFFLFDSNLYYFKYSDLIFFNLLNCTFFQSLFISCAVFLPFLQFFYFTLFFLFFLFFFSFFLFFPFFSLSLYFLM